MEAQAEKAGYARNVRRSPFARLRSLPFRWCEARTVSQERRVRTAGAPGERVGPGRVSLAVLSFRCLCAHRLICLPARLTRSAPVLRCPVPIEMGDTSTWPASAVAARRERATSATRPGDAAADIWRRRSSHLRRVHAPGAVSPGTWLLRGRRLAGRPGGRFSHRAGDASGVWRSRLPPPASCLEALGAPGVRSGGRAPAPAPRRADSGVCRCPLPEFAHHPLHARRDGRRARQRRGWPTSMRVRWLEAWNARPARCAAASSQRAADALPVHRVQMTTQGLRGCMSACAGDVRRSVGRYPPPRCTLPWAAPPEGVRPRWVWTPWRARQAARVRGGFPTPTMAPPPPTCSRARPRGALLLLPAHRQRGAVSAHRRRT